MSNLREPKLAANIDGRGLTLFANAISPSLLPFQNAVGDDAFPTSLFVSLLGEDEDWGIRGEEIGGALIRELRLTGSINTERAVRHVLDWLKEHHPGAQDVGVLSADYRGVQIVVRLDYPPRFLWGIFQRVSWETRGKKVTATEADPYLIFVSV